VALRRVGWLFAVLVAVAACGESAARPPESESSVTAVGAESPASQSAPNTAGASSGSPQATDGASTVPISAPEVSTLGPLTFTLPEGVVANPRPEAPRPDFVVALARWLIPERSSLIVAIQNVTPPIPEQLLLRSFDANGLHWEMFNGGPGDGSQVMAVTSFGAESILVSAQGWTPDEHQFPAVVVEQVARSLSVREG